MHIVWVDETECIGCNLCSAVCPVPGCIAMTDVTDGRPSGLGGVALDGTPWRE